MGTSGPTPDITPEDVCRIFSQLDVPCVPLTTAEVADALECPDQIARENLATIADRGELRTRRLEGRTRVWWATGEERERERRHAKLREYGAFIRAVEDHAIYTLDPDGVVIGWNEGAERIKQYTEDEIVGEHVSIFYTDEDVDDGRPERNLETAAAEGHAEDRGWRTRKDGTRFWANVVITAIRDDDGTLQGFTKVTRDLTERREYDQQLRRELDQTKELLRIAPIAIAIQDSEGKTVLANQRAKAALGMSEVESIEGFRNESDWKFYNANGELLSPDEIPSVRVLATGEPVFDEELTIELPSGVSRQFQLNAAPLVSPDGTVDRVVTAGEDITELKIRQRQLERRKAELESELSEVVHRISDAFYALDEQWRFTHLNDRAAELMRRSRDELLGKELWEVFPGAADVYREHFQAALEAQEPVTFEVYAENLGSWLEFTVYPSETGLSIYFRDVTERKDREQTLVKYETIVETVNDGIYVRDEDGVFTLVNDAYAKLTGYDREELIGAHASLVVDGATIEPARETKEAMAAGDGADQKMEAMIHRADGKLVPSERTFATIETNDGGVEQVGVVRDISERKEYERKIEESERRYRTLAENFPGGMVALFDSDLRYVAAGGELLEALGIERGEAIGESIHERYPDEIVAEIEPHFHAALDGESNSFEVEYYGRDLLAHTLPISPAGANRTGMLVVQDVTERREYQRQLEASNERLEQFAYIASHDLQEPLRMVTSYLQLIERRYDDQLDQDGTEFIRFAVDGAERMHEMINGLLDYSRVETQGDPFERVDLNAVLSDVRDDLQLQITDSDAEITAETLPTVSGDPNQLRQVFQNLLDNAIEYCGDEPPRIHVTAERTGDEWVCSVSDEGIGIDPGDAERIFEVFQRLHGPDEHPGTGIGLALCRRIVDRHGGELWVRSEPGDGATFSFTLPAEEARGG